MLWIFGHIIEPHRPRGKDRRDHGRGARIRHWRERVSGRARQRIEHGGVGRFGLGHPIEERAELGVRQFRRDVGHLLGDRLAVQRRGDDGADLAQFLGVGGVFARRRQESRALGDIAGHLGSADNLASVVEQRRHGQRDRQPGAISMLPDRLVVIDLVAGPDLGEHHIFLGLQFVRNQHADGPPDGVGRRVAEHAFRRRIPRRDRAVQVLGDDRIVGRLDDGDEPATGRGGLRAVRDVTGDFRRADHPARIIVNRRDGQRDRNQRPVLALADGVEVRDPFARSNAPEDHVLLGLPIGRNDHANRLADRFRCGVAKHAFSRTIPGGDDAVQVLADDRVI
jgi:hypothetical protein